jgi:opacity protein-like surface antigen
MRRCALIGMLGAGLAAGPAFADGATQALGAIGAAANFGLCLFRSAQIEDAEDEARENAAEAGAEVAKAPGAESYVRRGLFAGLGGATAVELFDGDGARGREVGFGLAARSGFRCSDRQAAELAFEWIEGFDGDGPADRPLWTLTSNAKVALLTGRTQPFLLAGIGFLRGDVPGYKPRTDLTGRLGGGVDVFVTPAIAVSVDASYVIPTGNVQKFDYVSIEWGLRYHF